MTNPQRIHFDRFTLDQPGARLFDGSRQVPLTPRAFDLLCLLASAPDRLFTKRELLDTLWQDTVVGDAVLKVAIREIRKALDDDVRTPRCIATVHRRGYRFLAATSPGMPSVPQAPVEPQSQPQPPQEPRDRPLVGRHLELQLLRGLVTSVDQHHRQLAFATGMPGLGKSTLLAALTHELRRDGRHRIAHGQCIEHHGAGEAWLPILQALGELIPGEPALSSRVLREHAPSWLPLLPALPDAGMTSAHAAQHAIGAPAARLLREICQALEQLSLHHPLVLVLEDLHWADPATLELLALLARRQTPARLLILGSWRPEDVGPPDSFQRRILLDLLGQPTVHELPLAPLQAQEIEQLLARRGHLEPSALAGALHARTGGLPLFVQHSLDWLEASAAPPEIALLEAPVALRTVILQRIARLDEAQRRLLEAASVVGVAWDSQAVAAALEVQPEVVEDQAHAIATARGLLTLDESTTEHTAGFRFSHAMLQQVLYDNLAPSRRRLLHRRIAARLTAAAPREAGSGAPALAHHLETAGDRTAAIEQLLLAASEAQRRAAHEIAAAHLEHALELCGTAGPAALACRPRILRGRGLLERSRGDFSAAALAFDAAARLLRDRPLQDRDDRSTEAELHLLAASAWFWRDRSICLERVERARELAESLPPSPPQSDLLGTCAHWRLTLRGYTPQDEQRCETAVAVARETGAGERLGVHLIRVAYARLITSRYDDAVSAAVEGGELALTRGDAFDYLLSLFLRTWAALPAGHWGLARSAIRHGSEVAQRNGHELWQMLFVILEASLREALGDFDHAIALCDRAIFHAAQHPEASGQLAFHGGIVRGHALLGAGRSDEAAGELRRIRSVVEHSPHELDWLLRLPLTLGEARLALACGRTDEAIERAQELRAAAQVSGEQTYLALSSWVIGAAMAARGERAAARQCVDAALADLPAICRVAQWQLESLRASWQDGSRRREPLPVRNQLHATLRDFAPDLADLLPDLAAGPVAARLGAAHRAHHDHGAGARDSKHQP